VNSEQSASAQNSVLAGAAIGGGVALVAVGVVVAAVAAEEGASAALCVAAGAAAGLAISGGAFLAGAGAGYFADRVLNGVFGGTGGGRHMEDPNNPTVSKDDLLLGLWWGTKTAIFGAALNGVIGRRGGCYVIPHTHNLVDLVGRSAFLERVRLTQANPATDIGWGTEIALRPPSNIDWLALLKELRRKYEWVAGTVDRINKTTKPA
jgi:hypothetical protein